MNWNPVTKSIEDLPPEREIVLLQTRNDLPCIGYWEKDFLNRPLWNYVIRVQGVNRELPCYDPDHWMRIPKWN